jgi:hypothetical protein
MVVIDFNIRKRSDTEYTQAVDLGPWRFHVTVAACTSGTGRFSNSFGRCNGRVVVAVKPASCPPLLSVVLQIGGHTHTRDYDFSSGRILRIPCHVPELETGYIGDRNFSIDLSATTGPVNVTVEEIEQALLDGLQLAEPERFCSNTSVLNAPPITFMLHVLARCFKSTQRY